MLAIIAATLACCYILFVWWRLRLLRVCCSETIGPRWLARALTSMNATVAWLAGVDIVSVAGPGLDADPSRPYMYVWHPHGFVAYCATMLVSGMAVRKQPHGREWFASCAPVLFKIPLLGDIITVTNGRQVDRKSLEALLEGGASFGIQPGGIHEQAATRHDQEQALFPRKLGFIRLAIKYGRHLMPLYVFGENQLYKRVDGFEWLTRLIKRATGMTLPVVQAKYGLPQAGLLPIATPIHLRYGRPVDVGPPEDNPSEERVEQVFQSYLEELQAVFDENATACLPKEVAAKGLKVVRL